MLDNPVSQPEIEILNAEGGIETENLIRLCRSLGADDAGVVSISAPSLATEKQAILEAYGQTKAVLGFVIKANPENIRSPLRSIANVEFHRTGEAVENAARDILKALRQRGVNGLYPSMGFPMEMDRYPGRTWAVSHKTVAEATGMGKMGLHRLVIHPKFGNHIFLGTILLDQPVAEESAPIDFNPCMECRLCVAACPVSAISSSGRLNFSACFNHNYREFMGGFTQFTETIADAKDAKDLRKKVSDSQSASWWQSLSYGPNYKAAYCMAVCPAGEEIIQPYQTDKRAFKNTVVKPLIDKEEDIYVLARSDALEGVQRRFKHKRPIITRSSLRPTSVAGFLRSLDLVFNPGKAKGMDVVYRFQFTGQEQLKATIVIKDKTLTVDQGWTAEPDLTLVADSQRWLDYLRRDRGLFPALISRRIKVTGKMKLLKDFSRCFPG